MKKLSIILLTSGILTCCCTSVPHAIEPSISNNRFIDSCEVFLRRLRANMVLDREEPHPHYGIRGEWAKQSKEYPNYFNVEVAFKTYRDCIIGLTHSQVKDLFGKPTYIDPDGSQYLYLYTRRDTSSIRTPVRLRLGSIAIYNKNDTIQNVYYSGGSIRIE